MLCEHEGEVRILVGILLRLQSSRQIFHQANKENYRFVDDLTVIVNKMREHLYQGRSLAYQTRQLLMLVRLDKRVVERGFNSYIKHFIVHNFGPNFHDLIGMLYTEVNPQGSSKSSSKNL